MNQRVQRKKGNTGNSQEFTFDWTVFLEILKKKWYWVLLSILFWGAAGYVYLQRQQPLYQRSAVLQIKNGNKGTDLSSFLELQDVGSAAGNSVEDELYIIRSLQILEQVALRLGLDVTYAYEGYFRDEPIYRESAVKVEFLDEYAGYTTCKVVPIDAKSYSLTELSINGGEAFPDYQRVAYGDTLKTAAGRLIVHLNEMNPRPDFEKTVKVSRRNLNGTVTALQGALETNLLKKGGSLVKISYTGNNLSLTDAVLNCLSEEYTQALWNDKKRVIESTAAFIDERTKVIGEELGNVEKKLTDYKQKNQIVNVSSSAETYLSESSTARAEVNQIRSQISVAQYIKNYVQDRTKRNELIPNVSGVGDAGVQSQIGEYNELMLKRNRLSLSSSEASPVVVKMNTMLDAMRTTITGALDNYLNTLNLQLNSSLAVQQDRKSVV